jgi:hypothetical protein
MAMNDIVKKADNYAARYDTGDDPYAQFANEGGPGIQGKLLACRKGVYGIGKEATPPPVGACYLFITDSMMRGWLKWAGGVVVDADLGPVGENFLVKHRLALGDPEEDGNWEKNPDGTSRDPWSKAYRALLIELSPPHGELTFSGGSYGTELGFKALAGAYAAERSQHPGGTYPVVQLATAPWTSKNYGKQIRPDFPIVGWATVEDVRSGRKVLAAPVAAPVAKPKAKAKAATPAKTMAEELGDEIPAGVWGK